MLVFWTSYSSKESWKKCIKIFTSVLSSRPFSILLRNGADQHIKMISEGARDTEDWRNNSALHHRNELHLKYYNRKQLYMFHSNECCLLTPNLWLMCRSVDQTLLVLTPSYSVMNLKIITIFTSLYRCKLWIFSLVPSPSWDVTHESFSGLHHKGKWRSKQM